MAKLNYELNRKLNFESLDDFFRHIINELKTGACPSTVVMQGAVIDFFAHLEKPLLIPSLLQMFGQPLPAPAQANTVPKPDIEYLAEIMNGLVRTELTALLASSRWPESTRAAADELLRYTEDLVEGNQNAKDPNNAQIVHIFNTHLLLYQFLTNPSQQNYQRMTDYAATLSGHKDAKSRYMGLLSLAISVTFFVLGLNWYLPAILLGASFTLTSFSMLVLTPLSCLYNLYQFRHSNSTCLSGQLERVATAFWTARNLADDQIASPTFDPILNPLQ